MIIFFYLGFIVSQTEWDIVVGSDGGNAKVNMAGRIIGNGSLVYCSPNNSVASRDR